MKFYRRSMLILSFRPNIQRMNRKCVALVAGSVLILSILRAQDAKFAADSLQQSRDFYSKAHFVAIANSPVSFKYDRYPSEGPERMQCDDGTYTRQHGKPWMYSQDKMRAGLPLDYSERNRYVMTFALREEWGRSGRPVDQEVARKLDGWIKIVEAALNISPTNAKLVSKSETDDRRAQWVFEVLPEKPGGTPLQLTFRKPITDRDEDVLLHEFSGPLRLAADQVIAGGASETVRLGFGYMMLTQQGNEVSEFVWEEMQRSGGAKATTSTGGSLPPPAQPVSSNSKEATTYSERGTLKDEKGDFDGAIADYTRAIELDPKFSQAYYNRGLAKKHKGDMDGAIADYDRVIEMNPDNPKFARAYCDRGVARRKKGDTDGAIADYNRCLELDPKYSIAYFNRGNARDEKRDFDGALADYNRGLELDARNAKAYASRAGIYFEKKQYAAAVKDIEKSIELDGKNGESYAGLGWYQIFNRKPRESIAASRKALQLSPDDAVMINGNLAHGYLFDNQFEKAKAIYLKNKDARLQDGRTFPRAVLDDFKEFQEAGLTHPDMEKIKALLGG